MSLSHSPAPLKSCSAGSELAALGTCSWGGMVAVAAGTVIAGSSAAAIKKPTTAGTAKGCCPCSSPCCVVGGLRNFGMLGQQVDQAQAYSVVRIHRQTRKCRSDTTNSCSN